jgi:hypothetical protein
LATFERRVKPTYRPSYNSLYLMGAYDSSNGKYTTRFSEKLLVDAFKKAGKRLDIGNCCLHFKELDDLELTSVAKVIAMSTPKEYLAYYRRVNGLTRPEARSPDRSSSRAVPGTTMRIR